jgi:predicted NBD/HSP70 family sugar kinase
MGSGREGGDLAALREQNARLLLSVLLEAPDGLTQHAITDRTGLARSTVSTLLSQNLSGVLGDSPGEAVRPGRPARKWTVAADATYTVGVDIGRSHVGVGLLDAHRRAVGACQFEHVADTYQSANATMRLARRLLKRVVASEERCARVAAITVGLPGPLVNVVGSERREGVPSWRGFDVRQRILTEWPSDPVPEIIVESDANLGGLAESHYGKAKGPGSTLFLKWSGGIAAALTVGGTVWRAGGGLAGELGHMPTVLSSAQRRTLGTRDGETCGYCGERECLESVTGGIALARTLGAKDLREVLAWAADEKAPAHRRAQAALAAASSLISATLAPLVRVLDPELLVIGGPIARQAEASTLEGFKQALAAGARAAKRGPSVEISELGPESYATAAALLAAREQALPFILASTGTTAQVARAPNAP